MRSETTCAIGSAARPKNASPRSTSSDDRSMDIPNDFKELLELFTKHNVEYVIVGGYGNTPVQFISREDFIANKRATGRLKDAADIEALGGE